MFAPAYVGLASRAKPIQILSSGVPTLAKWANRICFFLGPERRVAEQPAVCSILVLAQTLQPRPGISRRGSTPHQPPRMLFFRHESVRVPPRKCVPGSRKPGKPLLAFAEGATQPSPLPVAQTQNDNQRSLSATGCGVPKERYICGIQLSQITY
jgi:hypothetical protein